MSNGSFKQPVKSILKHKSDDFVDIENVNFHNTLQKNAPQSWFSSKFTVLSNEMTAKSTTTRVNTFFGPKKQNQQQKDNMIELGPRQIRRVRFPVTDMITEYLFTKEDIVISEKSKKKIVEPINIKTSAQLLSLYESVCRNKQEPTINLLVSTLIVIIYISHVNFVIKMYA